MYITNVDILTTCINIANVKYNMSLKSTAQRSEI